MKQDVTKDFVGVELQADDPESLAKKWATIVDTNPVLEQDGTSVALNNARLRFVDIKDGRGPGLSGIDIKVTDRAQILETAKQRGCYTNDHQVTICGTHFYLSD